MTKQRHCFVAQVGDAIEALASALDPEREPPFKGDILDLLEWAIKDVLEMRQQVTLLRASVEELIPQNPLDTEHQYKVHHRALKALTTMEHPK